MGDLRLKSPHQSRSFPQEAIVLAGGLGKRLRSVVPDLPKPMASVANRPFLAHVLIYLAQQGVRRVILSVGYKSEILMDCFGASFHGLALEYVIEQHPLGTAGGLRLGLEQVQGDRAFVLNGDTLFDVTLSELNESFEQHVAQVVMAVKPMSDCTRYGAVQIDEGQRVTGFWEKGRQGPGLINGGVFLLDRHLHGALADCFSFETDFLQPNINQLIVTAVVCDGFFIDIGIPEDYVAAQTLLANRVQNLLG
ncbi:MAG: nucleotidyltransferase family protein [Magnetococcus sp. YQC-5]